MIANESLGEREPERPNCRRGYVIKINLTEI
jgi:hypothetical protein